MRSVIVPILVAAAPAAARDLPVAFPVDCTLGVDCYIQNYVDADPAEGAARDFACGSLTYDGHKGTDIALPTLAAMAEGVDVLSVAPGVVAALREGMPDISIRDPDAPDLGGRDCGNGLVIDHGRGWSSQYCHLAEGSIVVTQGQRVGAGAVLGRIGLSGRTEFPHLHMTLREDGEIVDPFERTRTEACDDASPLWRDAPDYVPTGILGAGLLDRLPDYDEVKAGGLEVTDLPRDGTGLVAWVYVFGGRAADELRFAIDGPDGEFHRSTDTLERSQAILYRGAGRRTPPQGWPSGTYEARIQIVRDGEVIDETQTSVTLR